MRSDRRKMQDIHDHSKKKKIVGWLIYIIVVIIIFIIVYLDRFVFAEEITREGTSEIYEYLYSITENDDYQFTSYYNHQTGNWTIRCKAETEEKMQEIYNIMPELKYYAATDPDNFQDFKRVGIVCYFEDVEYAESRPSVGYSLGIEGRVFSFSLTEFPKEYEGTNIAMMISSCDTDFSKVTDFACDDDFDIGILKKFPGLKRIRITNSLSEEDINNILTEYSDCEIIVRQADLGREIIYDNRVDYDGTPNYVDKRM
ncbi:MAG: hypothetical protein ACI4XF_01550 [Oscillospiraceae bacterium]